MRELLLNVCFSTFVTTQYQLLSGMWTICKLHHFMGGIANCSIAVTSWTTITPPRSLFGGFCCLLLCCYMVLVFRWHLISLLSIRNIVFYGCYKLLITLSCSLAMFYVIALAGAHKRVINQLREQLVMVGLLNICRCFMARIQHLWHACPTGGPWQALPHPEAVPGSEGRCCQISSVEPTQRLQLQLSHQLFQQFQRVCVPGTPGSRFCHTRVRCSYTSKDQLDIQGDKPLWPPTYLCFVLFFCFFYFDGENLGASVDILLLYINVLLGINSFIVNTNKTPPHKVSHTILSKLCVFNLK